MTSISLVLFYSNIGNTRARTYTWMTTSYITPSGLRHFIGKARVSFRTFWQPFTLIFLSFYVTNHSFRYSSPHIILYITLHQSAYNWPLAKTIITWNWYLYIYNQSAATEYCDILSKINEFCLPVDITFLLINYCTVCSRAVIGQWVRSGAWMTLKLNIL